MNRRLIILGTVFVLVALFVGVNMLAGAAFRSVRLDATQDKLFTLTKGSRAIAASPKDQVTLTLYFSSKMAQGNPAVQSYAQRVRELLEEYVRNSGGKIVLKVVDPEPFSEAEDAAVSAGMQGVPMNAAGEKLYFGLVGVNKVDTRETIAFFDPRSERLLEYDVSRMVYSLANPQKKKLGILSSLPIEGGFRMDPRTQQPRQTRAWQVIAEVKQGFEVKNLGGPAGTTEVAAIPDDVGVLLVVHPKNLSEKTLYAIDQFVLRGGRLLAFVDPFCEQDMQQSQFGPGNAGASDLNKILNAWGYEVPSGFVVADSNLAQRVLAGTPASPEEVSFVVWLGLKKENLDKDDLSTAPIANLNFATAGHIKKLSKDGEAGEPTVKLTALASSSVKSGEMPTAFVQATQDPKGLAKQFVAGEVPLVLAGRFSGPAKSAFPDGPPAEKGESAKAEEGKPEPEVDLSKHLKESSAPITAIVVADVDMLADGMWMREQELFAGLASRQKLAGNGDFALGAIDNLSGSDELISVRARGSSARPFTVIEEMQKRADDRLLAEQAVLEAKLADAQDRISKLESKREAGDKSLVLTPEQQKELDKFRQESLETRRALRKVKLTLRQDIESLQTKLKLVNIALMPVIVTIGAATVGAYRVARRREAAKGRGQ